MAAIHGDKKQDEREYVLNQFKSSNINVLIATDVAARGIDVEDIKFVINFDYPNCAEDYIHRIGRTARAERTGVYDLCVDTGMKTMLIRVICGA